MREYENITAIDCRACGRRTAENHLHQLHICLPSREGHTRLLYRMAMDFMDWTRHVPGIQLFWRNIAGQVRACDTDGPREGVNKWSDRCRPPRAGC